MGSVTFNDETHLLLVPCGNAKKRKLKKREPSQNSLSGPYYSPHAIEPGRAVTTMEVGDLAIQEKKNEGVVFFLVHR